MNHNINTPILEEPIIIRHKKSVKNRMKSVRLLDFHLYDEKNKKEKSENSIESKESIEFERKKDESEFHIQLFGINEIGETFSILINDFHPFFFVKVGDQWTYREVNQFVIDLKKKIGKYYEDSILDAKLVENHKLYGFSGGKKYKFVQLIFKNQVVMNKTKNLWYEYIEGREGRRMKPYKFPPVVGIQLELYEGNIPPLLRYFHIHNISPSGWVYLPIDQIFKPELKSTTCTYEYICKASQIKSIQNKETRVPYKICSFDIEASSSHGDFPVPKKTYKLLAMNLVDCFLKQIQSQTMDMEKSKHLIRKIIMTAFGFDHFEDIELVYPKKTPTKEAIKRLIEKLLITPIEIIQKTATDEMTELITIDSIFEEIKENHMNHEGGGGGDDDMDDDVEKEESGISYKKSCKKPKKSNKEYTIIELLLNNELEREEQINETNKVLTFIGFPELEGDKTTFIGSTFMKYGDSEPYLNHCIVLNSCDPVENAVIETVDTEKELLLKWTELIQQENPDIIIGYNIFGFDYEFLFRRAEENNCVYDFLKLSRKVGELCANEKKNFKESNDPDSLEMKESGKLTIENTKIAIASGEYDLRYPKITGRLQIDMYAYLRRDFNLSSYKLDDVAGQFISDDISKIECITHPIYGEITELYSKNLTGLHKGDYIHIEISSFTSDYYKDGKKFCIVDIEKNREVKEMKKGKETLLSYNVIFIGGHETIDSSKNIKWCMAKDDVTPQDIFRLSNGNSTDRAIVAKYCIQDCNLVHHLMNKIDVLTGYVEMSRICSVPISFLVFRGQGIKLTSYVAKKCREKNTLMPDLEKSYSNDGYEGAIVLPPKCSMYMDNPVACVDYSSLYPSSMISQNYSPDSKVWTKEFDLKGELTREMGERDGKTGLYIYDNLPGYEYIDLEFDLFEYRRNPEKPSAKAVKTKVGTKICRWAQFPDNKKGIMPSILEELLKARSDTRKMIKTEKDPFMQNILDKRQLGYKVTANSLYGQCGSKTSTFFEKDVAASTTATGRMMIIYAKTMIEEIYGDRIYDLKSGESVRTKAEYIYGDSVASYTPVYIKAFGSFVVTTIEGLVEIYGENKWVKCEEEGKQDKEYCELNGISTWTETGWTPLKRVIRHLLAPHKKMFRVMTPKGIVDVTDDHSLLTKDGQEISPKDVKIGTELLHFELPHPTIEIDYHSIDEARIMGFFFGCGRCNNKSDWVLRNTCPIMTQKYLELCQNTYKSFGWTSMDTNAFRSYGKKKSKVEYDIILYSFIQSDYTYKCKFIQNYHIRMYQNGSKIIPTTIYHSNRAVQQAFFEGFLDSHQTTKIFNENIMNIDNQLTISHIICLSNILGWDYTIDPAGMKSDPHFLYSSIFHSLASLVQYTMKPTLTRYRLCIFERSNSDHDNTHYEKKYKHTIQKIEEINYQGYVYDLTTENHHFAAGLGSIIVHNTDSVFFTFNLENPNTGERVTGKKALEITIEIAQDAAKLCSQWLKPPMELSYEKTLDPFILLSKKRYVGMLYEEDPNKGKMKYMGLSLKRRDSCDYLKDTYGGVLNIIMEEQDIEKAVEFLYDSLNQLVNGKVHMDKLMITKALRGYYKNPKQIAHKVLADRIGQRDPGNKPKPGDRMRFIHIVNKDKHSLQGEKIETPEFIISNKLKIDYAFYITNQLFKPLSQLFGLSLEQIWKYQGKETTAIPKYRREIVELEKEYPDLEIFMKKKEKFCTAKVKVLLFDKYLNKINNLKNGNQELFAFYGKK
jgi:DNA polymerase elongation subunit (family B)